MQTTNNNTYMLRVTVKSMDMHKTLSTAYTIINKMLITKNLMGKLRHWSLLAVFEAHMTVLHRMQLGIHFLWFLDQI